MHAKDIVIRKSEFVAKSQFLSFCANYAKIIRKNAHCVKITQILRKKMGSFRGNPMERERSTRRWKRVRRRRNEVAMKKGKGGRGRR